MVPGLLFMALIAGELVNLKGHKGGTMSHLQISSDFSNKVPKAGWLINHRNLFLVALKAESLWALFWVGMANLDFNMAERGESTLCLLQGKSVHS